MLLRELQEIREDPSRLWPYTEYRLRKWVLCLLGWHERDLFLAWLKGAADEPPNFYCFVCGTPIS